MPQCDYAITLIRPRRVKVETTVSTLILRRAFPQYLIVHAMLAQCWPTLGQLM